MHLAGPVSVYQAGLVSAYQVGPVSVYCDWVREEG